MKIFQQEISESHRNIVKSEGLKDLLCKHRWLVLGENGGDELLTFREDGVLTILNKGKRRQGIWRYNSHTRSVYLAKFDFTCNLLLFFWNKVVLVLQLQKNSGYLFLINAAYADRFDCMLLEDFNAYASQWEQGQAVKREKAESLKNMRTEQGKTVRKLEKMGVGKYLSEEQFAYLAELWAENEQTLKEEEAKKREQLRIKLKSAASHQLAEHMKMAEKKYSEQLKQQRREAEDEVSQLRQKLIKEIELCIDLMKEQEELNLQKNAAQQQLGELKKQSYNREPSGPLVQPEPSERQKQPEPSDPLEQHILMVKNNLFKHIKVRVNSYLQSRSFYTDIEMDKTLDKDKKYKKIWMTKIIVMTVLATLMLFLFPELWNIIYYEGAIDYLGILLYTFFLFLFGGSTILAYCFFNLSEESYKAKLKDKIAEKHQNDFIDSLMP